ncbi:MAG: hypothetical protein ACJ77N_06550 [Chloroflexota bacterium]|jgi:hypothetical protein
MELLLLVAIVVVAAAASWAWGVDSRDESSDPRRSVYPVGLE